jgi:hypothetical protein
VVKPSGAVRADCLRAQPPHSQRSPGLLRVARPCLRHLILALVLDPHRCLISVVTSSRIASALLSEALHIVERVPLGFVVKDAVGIINFYQQFQPV